MKLPAAEYISADPLPSHSVGYWEIVGEADIRVERLVRGFTSSSSLHHLQMRPPQRTRSFSRCWKKVDGDVLRLIIEAAAESDLKDARMWLVVSKTVYSW